MAAAAPAVNLSERAAGCPSALPSLRFIAAESVLLAFQSNFFCRRSIGGRELVLKILRLLNPQLRGLLFGGGERGGEGGRLHINAQTDSAALLSQEAGAGAIFVSPAAMTNSFGGNT